MHECHTHESIRTERAAVRSKSWGSDKSRAATNSIVDYAESLFGL